jgi:hypothetical protein
MLPPEMQPEPDQIARIVDDGDPLFPEEADGELIAAMPTSPLNQLPPL